jgi:hypothetical protein
MLNTVFFGILLIMVSTSAHARRWQDLHVGYREFETPSGTEGITLVYSVTADVMDGAVVFDLDFERRGRRVSHSVAEVRLPKAEVPQFEAALKTFDQWRDESRGAAVPAFEKTIARIAGIEWWFHWTGREAYMRSGAGLRRHPVEFAEQDVTVFRVLLVSAPDMEAEIAVHQRVQADDRKRRRHGGARRQSPSEAVPHD